MLHFSSDSSLQRQVLNVQEFLRCRPVMSTHPCKLAVKLINSCNEFGIITVNLVLLGVYQNEVNSNDLRSLERQKVDEWPINFRENFRGYCSVCIYCYLPE